MKKCKKKLYVDNFLSVMILVEEADIIELEKKYWVLQAQSKSGRFDLDTFMPLISPPMPVDLCEGKRVFL